MILRLEAEAELVEAFHWYESRRPGLGREFIAAVDTALIRIAEAPTSFPVVYRGLQRVVLGRFPFLVYFRQEEGVVYVIAILHGRRNRAALHR